MSASGTAAREVDKVEENSTALREEQARSYQIELFEHAKRENTIVCLGTGTGKTFISVLLIKHFEHQVTGPWLDSNGTRIGKRTVFLAPTVPLVEQQHAVLEQHMSVKTACFVGSDRTDRWDRERWDEALEGPGVVVMTPEICRIAISHDILPIENINLLILDECHRATGNDPYVQIMQSYSTVPPAKRPRVLGLTASVVNDQVQGAEVQKRIKELEARLCSVARTACRSVMQFGTKPTEIIVAHEEHRIEKEFPIDQTRMSFLKDAKSPEFDEFNKMMNAMADTYNNCGAYCAKTLLQFRARELDKALHAPDCPDLFKTLARTKLEMFREIDEFLGVRPSPYDVPPKMKKLLEILKQFENTELSAVVFVQKRMVAYVLYEWMNLLSREVNGEYHFISCAFIVGQSQGSYSTGREDDPTTLKMNSKAQEKTMKDFRRGMYNLLFATSVIEEGMDVPACNLIVRFDPPLDVRSYTQSKGRARAKPSLYVVMTADGVYLRKTQAAIDSFQETEQLVMEECGRKRIAPTAAETAELLKGHPDLPPYENEKRTARITAASAISLIYGYCQRFMRMKYPNVFPFFDVVDTPEGFVCKLTMPIVCPVREPVSSVGHPFPNKDSARAFVALEMCKRLHQCGEFADNLLPRRMILNLYKLEEKKEDRKPKKSLKKGMIVNKTKNGDKKRYVLPRKQADILTLREEAVGSDVHGTYHLYVIKTEVITWASQEQNWRGDKLFDPTKYPTWLGMVMRSKSSKMRKVPKFPIYTRSGEELVSFVYGGSLSLNETEKKLCSRFNRYAFTVVLGIKDNIMYPAPGFCTPCIVPVNEVGSSGRFALNTEVLEAVNGQILRLPDPDNFVFREEDYEDAVVELLYHTNENVKAFSRAAHDTVPQDLYTRCYVVETRTRGEDGQELTPHSTGYYPFEPTLSFANYALQRQRRAGPKGIVDTYQPVMTIQPCQGRLSMLRYRLANQQERRQNFTQDTAKKYLVPQFAALHAIKGSLWRKITSIPSIIHRLNRLLIAEEIRLEISTACRLRPINYPSEQWPPMDFVPPIKDEPKETTMREFDALVRNGDRSFDRSKLPFPSMKQPDLRNCLGPSPCDIMRALTTKACCEVFDLERLELLGDSFLQIVSTFFVVDSNPKKDIGELNVLRQYEVNNNHLLYRAHDKGLTNAIDCQQFKATHNFMPFGFRAHPLEKHLLQRELLSFLVEVLGYEHDSSPRLKDVRFCRGIRDLLKLFDSTPLEELKKEVNFQILTSDDLPHRQEVPVRLLNDFKSKVGGDVVEALAGVFLETCGPVGALRFFRWIGKDFGDTETDNFLDCYKLDFSAAQKVPLDKMKEHQHRIDKVERQIGYTFRSKGLVLQAITHHSYREHLLTEDNNKLAFVGEAVVDYLLTLYIYGLSSSLSPGQLTDLRCSLINNQVTAHAVVRAELHTVLLYTNNKLFSTIKKYLSSVDDIGLRLDTAFDDFEADDVEEAEIPSPISRILQSVLGAVFIDSNKSLETVWDILVNIMGYEISVFTNNVPMSPVRELCMRFPGSTFSKATLIREGEDEGRFEVELRLVKGEQTEYYRQISDSKKIAKTTLAKRYLKKLYDEEKAKVIEERKRAHKPDESVSTMTDSLCLSELNKTKYYRRV